MNALLTDLYELTMAAGYFEAGKTAVWLRALRPLCVPTSERRRVNAPYSRSSFIFPPCLRASVVNNPL
jgi:hypothetical protein